MKKVVMRVGRENVVFFINGAGLIDFSYGKMNLFPGGFYMWKIKEIELQWLRLHTPNTGGPGSISGQGTRSHMLQLKDPAWHNENQRFHVLQLRPGTAKQISEYFFKERDYLPTKSNIVFKKRLRR